MPKRTVETYVNVKFDVSEGTMEAEGQEPTPIRVLHVADGGTRMDFPMSADSAAELADALRGSGIVTARVVPIKGTKGR